MLVVWQIGEVTTSRFQPNFTVWGYDHRAKHPQHGEISVRQDTQRLGNSAVDESGRPMLGQHSNEELLRAHETGNWHREVHPEGLQCRGDRHVKLDRRLIRRAQKTHNPSMNSASSNSNSRWLRNLSAQWAMEHLGCEIQVQRHSKLQCFLQQRPLHPRGTAPPSRHLVFSYDYYLSITPHYKPRET